MHINDTSSGPFGLLLELSWPCAQGPLPDSGDVPTTDKLQRPCPNATKPTGSCIYLNGHLMIGFLREAAKSFVPLFLCSLTPRAWISCPNKVNNTLSTRQPEPNSSFLPALARQGHNHVCPCCPALFVSSSTNPNDLGLRRTRLWIFSRRASLSSWEGSNGYVLFSQYDET